MIIYLYKVNATHIFLFHNLVIFAPRGHINLNCAQNLVHCEQEMKGDHFMASITLYIG